MFTTIFVPPQFRAVLSDHSWLQAMLDVERALAAAEARAGVIPGDAAERIAAACHAERFDPVDLAEQGRAAGNPVEPLVRALTEAVEGDAARYVHWGTTSQDVLDTAAMLVSRDALDLLIETTDGLARRCAELADGHRSTLMAARTLLQQAVPSTFGLKAAGWLVGVLEARRELLRVRHERLAVQLGGAAGTLAALEDTGPEVVRAFADDLGLSAPVVPWHTNRVRIAELGGALGLVAGVAAKIGLDVALLSQTEVDEVAEAAGGVSSTMPQKRNPVASVLAIACARLVNGHVSVLLSALPQEHERAAGAWHSEWPALSGALAFAGGAVDAGRRALEGLEVNAERMRSNLWHSGDLVMAERASYLLAAEVGRRGGYERVAVAAESGRPLTDELGLDAAELEPTSYLGSADAFVDKALAAYRSELG
jgi:3-carboxy-cis,cis-muconate cycloisomerase